MRKRVFGTALALCTMVPAVIGAQQSVQWNDAEFVLDQLKDPPVVRLSLSGNQFRNGEPVRVRFRVDDDAFVIVARVDWDGNLTVLYPTGRSRSTLVKGGEDRFIQGQRLGARGTFVAQERNGGTGFVFAMASYQPFDLTNLRQRDFSAWVTGVSAGQPAHRYIGDPHRVIQRFSQLVLFQPETEYDFDIAYYSVSAPTWVSASFSEGSCYDEYGFRRNNRGYGYGRGYYEYGYGYSGFDDGCGIPWGLRTCSFSYYSSLFGFPIGCYYQPRRQQVATRPPVQPPYNPAPRDTVLNPWAPDSVQRPNVDKTGNVNGPHIMTERATPPVRTAEPSDLSFSIPARALRRARAGRDNGGVAGSGAGTGPAVMPERPMPISADRPIEWVRPPREFSSPTGGRDGDRLPPRPSRRDNSGDDSRGARNWDPPPRAASPHQPERASSPPPVREHSRPSDGGTRSSPPPREIERPAPVRTQSEPTRPAPAPAREVQTRTESKPTEVKKP